MMACELGFIARSELKPSLRLVRAIPIDYFALNGNVAVPIGEFGADRFDLLAPALETD